MKERRSLDVALANSFVYADVAKAPVEEVRKSQEKSGFVSRIMEVEEREPTIRLTVDLPESMHKRLSLLSARSGKKKAAIVRGLLDEALGGDAGELQRNV